MLTALVLICSVTATPNLRDCSADNAAAVMRVPDQFGNPATCFMHAQAYLAESAIAQDVRQEDRVRILCARSDKVRTGGITISK